MVLFTGSCDLNPNQSAVGCTSPSASVSAFLLRLFVGCQSDKAATYSRTHITNNHVIAAFHPSCLTDTHQFSKEAEVRCLASR